MAPSALLSALRRGGVLFSASSATSSPSFLSRLALVPCAQMSTLVVAETQANQSPTPGGDAVSGGVRPSVGNAVAAARHFGEPVTVLVGGSQLSEAAETACRIEGADEVLCIECPSLVHGLAEPWTAALLWLQAQRGFSRMLAPSSAFSRSLLPRAAALLDAPMVSDVTSVVSNDTFVRPVYAGNALATVKCHAQGPGPILLSIRATSFPMAPSSQGPCPVSSLDLDLAAISDPTEPLKQALSAVGRSQWAGQEVRALDRPDLGAAKVVVSGGRGLKSAEGFAMLEELADKLGGAVGASRAAVDAGFVPNELQVGQTGKVVAPDLYIAVGISGAIQHLAGIKDSKTIVAINKDADTPIFQVADYGVVADLFEAVPELMAKVMPKRL